jgi:hypothetical protein
MAQMLTLRSSARARPSLRCVNASANPVQRQTSNSTSENATRAGSIAVVVARSVLSCSGSSSASSLDRSGRSAPAISAICKATFSGRRSAVCRYALASWPPSRSSARRGAGSRFRPAQISGRAAVHAEPLKSLARGSVNRPERVTNTSRRSSAATSASNTQNE